MKLTCTQENLVRGLHIVARLDNKGVNLPILNNVLLRAQKDGVMLVTTNLEMGIQTRIRGKIESQGEFTVNARLLSDFVSTLKKENITILLEEKSLSIQGENHQTTIRGIDASEFPVLPEIDPQYVFTANKQEFKQALSQVIFSVSTDESRPELCGVFLHAEGTRCVLASTDSYRLSEKTIAIKNETAGEKTIIIPSRTLQEVLRILEAEDAETITVKINESQVAFIFGETEVVSRIINGNYPDYKQIIPKNLSNSIEFDVAEMTRAIKTTALFCKQGINDIRLTLDKRFTDIVVQAENSTAGKNTSNVPSLSKGQEADIVFNYRFLLDGLTHVTAETAILKTSDATSPALLASSGDESFIYIIMPIRQ